MVFPVTVVGTTTWGTTLALVLARSGVSVSLLARTAGEAQALIESGENSRFLPGFPFPNNLRVTASEAEAFETAEMVVYAVPSATLRQNLQATRDHHRRTATIVVASKGLERTTGKRLTQVLQEELPSHLQGNICILSGPNLAKEIAAGKPASTVVAAQREPVAIVAQNILTSPTFRVYTSTDVLGVELAGALKHILVIGTGISDGLGFGDNAKAAFITRGLAEITRLGVAAGANPLTFAGLAGMGDLIATCSSPLSRNRYLGEELGKGRSAHEILATMINIVEGIDTTEAALRFAKGLGVEMPIVETTYRILFEGLSAKAGASELMERPPGPERFNG